MKNFWIGFEKRASVFGKIKPAIGKAVKNTENVLDYKKMNTPKSKPGPTLNYATMSPPKVDNTPLWKKRMEAKRDQVVRNNPGVVHDSQRGVVR